MVAWQQWWAACSGLPAATAAAVQHQASRAPLAWLRWRCLQQLRLSHVAGLTDAGVTSLSRELGRDVTVAEVLPLVEARLGRLLT